MDHNTPTPSSTINTDLTPDASPKLTEPGFKFNKPEVLLAILTVIILSGSGGYYFGKTSIKPIPAPQITNTVIRETPIQNELRDAVNGNPINESTVMGTVIIEGGRCCKGGTAGSVIPVHVEFEASSSAGIITEMRLKKIHGKKCFSGSEMEQADWEPFTKGKTFDVSVAINWQSFDVSVQYRDSVGNISPVYCDDLGVEGNHQKTM